METIDRLNAMRPADGWTRDAIIAAVAAVSGVSIGDAHSGDRTEWAEVRHNGRHIGTAWFRGESGREDEMGFDDQRIED